MGKGGRGRGQNVSPFRGERGAEGRGEGGGASLGREGVGGGRGEERGKVAFLFFWGFRNGSCPSSRKEFPKREYGWMGWGMMGGSSREGRKQRGTWGGEGVEKVCVFCCVTHERMLSLPSLPFDPSPLRAERRRVRVRMRCERREEKTSSLSSRRPSTYTRRTRRTWLHNPSFSCNPSRPPPTLHPVILLAEASKGRLVLHSPIFFCGWVWLCVWLFCCFCLVLLLRHSWCTSDEKRVSFCLFVLTNHPTPRCLAFIVFLVVFFFFFFFVFCIFFVFL